MKNLVGIVVIGRNEGPHLQACFDSLKSLPVPTIYVDSASIDQSVSIAKEYGVNVIELDPALKLTAARGRNAGFKFLTEHYPTISYVQFIDGDCRLKTGWLEIAALMLDEHPAIASVAGILNEFDADSSPYTRISKMEWKTEPGESKATGGVFMIRRRAFEEVGGFNPEIAGAEDTELCYRLRKNHWKIWQLDQPMAFHSTSMMTFKDFWRRSMRTGYAFSEVSGLHGKDPEKLFVRENRSTLILGGIFPILILALGLPTYGWSLIMLGAYPLLYRRIYRHALQKWTSQDAHLYALSCLLAKFPGFIGACKYYFKLLCLSYLL